MKQFTFHNVEQNTGEWLALRCGKATASSFSVFMANYGKAFGDPAIRYAVRIALETVNGKSQDGGFSNEHTERGHAQEPIARMLYEEQNFVTVSNGGFFDCGDHGTSPDGLINDDGVIEIKSVIDATHHATRQRGSFDPAYKWQIVGHLDCTGRDWVDFTSYCSAFPEDKQLFVHRVHREEMKDELEMLQLRRAEFLRLVKSIAEDIKRRDA